MKSLSASRASCASWRHWARWTCRRSSPSRCFPTSATTMHDELAFLSAADTARLIRGGEVSPVEVVQAYLARIERLDPTLRAYITVTAEGALAAAREAERAQKARAAIGPLFGVPVAVKDQFWTRGVLTTNGSRAYRDFVPTEDATVITRLAKAGAILLGKLAMSELALGGTRAPAWGIARKSLDTTPDPSTSRRSVPDYCVSLGRGI